MKKKINKNFNKYLVPSSSSIKKTIFQLNKYGLKLVCVVDDKKKLLGTISDGDIRRGLLKNNQLNVSVTKIMNRRPKTIGLNTTNYKKNKIFLKYEIDTIPVINKNRTLLDISNKDKENFLENIVYIMAGGRGKRMMPLTKNLPKPLLEYSGVPILERILLKLKSEGFNNVVISINYLGEKIEQHFQNGNSLGLNIRYIRETKEMGTAGSIQKLLKYQNNLPIIISNADLITSLNFEDLLAYHNHNLSDMTIATKNFEYQNPFGVILNKGKKVLKISEKPTYKFNVNAGVYVINHNLLNLIKKNKYLDMPLFIKNLIENKKKVNIFPLHEIWKDVGNPKDLE